jgi:hypothetical protein
MLYTNFVRLDKWIDARLPGASFCYPTDQAESTLFNLALRDTEVMHQLSQQPHAPETIPINNHMSGGAVLKKNNQRNNKPNNSVNK